LKFFYLDYNVAALIKSGSMLNGPPTTFFKIDFALYAIKSPLFSI